MQDQQPNKYLRHKHPRHAHEARRFLAAIEPAGRGVPVAVRHLILIRELLDNPQ